MNNTAELRIQLEGDYERVEVEVKRWENAVAALEHIYWDQKGEWCALEDRTAQLSPAVRHLSDRIAMGAQDDGHLIDRLRNAQTRFHHVLDLRLRGFGEYVEADTHVQKVQRLIDSLPVHYAASHWTSLVHLRLVLCVFLTAPFIVMFKSPWPAGGALLFLLASYLVRSPWLNIVVTPRSVIFGRTQWFLKELQQVTFESSFAAGFRSIHIVTKAGQSKHWHLYMSDTEKIERTLRELGVLVVVR